MAFVAGVVAAIVLIPLNKWVTNSIGRMSVKLMQCKDQRIKVWAFKLNRFCPHLHVVNFLCENDESMPTGSFFLSKSYFRSMTAVGASARKDNQAERRFLTIHWTLDIDLPFSAIAIFIT